MALADNPFMKKSGGAATSKAKGAPAVSTTPVARKSAPGPSTPNTKEKIPEDLVNMSNLDPSLVGHVTLHVPPPPGAEDRLEKRINALRAGAEIPTVSDTKIALDSMRDSILSYYAKIYSRPGGEIKSRLSALRQMSGVDTEVFPSALQHSGVNGVASPLQEVLGAGEKRLTGEEGVLSVVSDLTAQVMALEKRMDSAVDNLRDISEDPAMVTWDQNISSHPNAGNFQDSCKHLYGHLRQRSQRNSTRIKALQNRLRLVQTQMDHSKGNYLGIDQRSGL